MTSWSNWRLVITPQSPVAGDADSRFKRPVMRAAKATPPSPIQVNNQEKRDIKALNPIAVSRRNAMLYMSAAGFAILRADLAAARTGRQENRKKAMEKLEKLREKAGEKNAPSESPSQKEKTPIAPLVEASLP